MGMERGILRSTLLPRMLRNMRHKIQGLRGQDLAVSTTRHNLADAGEPASVLQK